MQERDVKARYVVVPVLNVVWSLWALVRLFTAPRLAAISRPLDPDTELSRRDAVISTLKPPM